MIQKVYIMYLMRNSTATRAQLPRRRTRRAHGGAFTHPRRLEVTIRRSKTDQEGFGRKVGIPYGGRPRTCPVRAGRDWIDLSLLDEGPLFRPINRFGKILPSRLTGQSVALIVKRWALEAGFDPALFAGHSLRSGLATAAAKAGKSERSIMKQTGHRSVTVVRRYIRDAELFDDNAAAGIGL